MAEEQDLYAVLGVERTATDDQIKRAYRKLARTHHPDVNPGNKEAEEKFKAISAAYDVLSNPEKRKLFDEFGQQGLRGGFDPEQARDYRRWSEGRAATGHEGGGIPYDFDFGDIFGGRVGRSAQRQWSVAGEDIVATVELGFVTALRGTHVEVHIPYRGAVSRVRRLGRSAGLVSGDLPRLLGQRQTPRRARPPEPHRHVPNLRRRRQSARALQRLSRRRHHPGRAAGGGAHPAGGRRRL